MEKIKVDKESLEIITKYKKINKFFFNYFIFIVLVVLSLLALFIYNGNKKLQVTEVDEKKSTIGFNISNDGQSLYGDMLFNSSQIVLQGIDMKVFLIRGYFVYTGGIINIRDSLSIYNGYVLPFDTIIQPNINIGNIQDLSSGKYSIELLDNYFSKVLKSEVSKNKLNYNLKQNVLKPLDNGTITDTFLLGCLQSGKIIDKYCKYNLEKLIQDLYIYNIQTDINGIKIAFEKSKQMNLQDQFCKGLQKYYYYSFNITDSFKNIVEQCGEEFVKEYNLIYEFKKVTDEIENDKFSLDVSFNTNINEYKLVSMMRMIIINGNKGTYNFDTITKYLEFLGVLMKNSQKIEKGYFDIAYYFNNTELKTQLALLEKDQSQKAVANIPKLKDLYETVSKGNILSNNSIGLSSLINNKELENVFKQRNSQINIVVQDLKKDFSIFIGKYKFFVPFEVIEDKEKKSIYTKGIIKGTIDNGKSKLTIEINDVELMFDYDSTFILKQVVMKDTDKDIQNAINTLIQKNPGFNLNELFNKIIDLKSLTYFSNDICQYLNEKISLIQESSVKECDKSHVVLFKKDLQFTFKYDNLKLLSYDVNDEQIKKQLESTFGKTVLLENLGPIIVDMISIIKQSSLTGTNVTTNDLQIPGFIEEKFQKYLQIKPTKIVLENGVYKVSFVLNGLSLIVDVNVSQNYKMTNLVLIYKRDTMSKEIIYNFNGMDMNLVESSKFDLNYFKEKTQDYLNKLNTELYNKYLKDSKYTN